MIYLSLDGFNDELSVYVHWLEYIRMRRYENIHFTYNRDQR